MLLETFCPYIILKAFIYVHMLKLLLLYSPLSGFDNEVLLDPRIELEPICSFSYILDSIG